MASPTKKVTIVRARKVAKQGAKAKNKIRRLGTTAPNLPLNKPNANELAQATKTTKTAKAAKAPKAAAKAPAVKAKK
jgi:hypothetical protein